jgi:hypothetical protein
MSIDVDIVEVLIEFPVIDEKRIVLAPRDCVIIDEAVTVLVVKLFIVILLVHNC